MRTVRIRGACVTLTRTMSSGFAVSTGSLKLVVPA
jgi:hypothetical protein